MRSTPQARKQTPLTTILAMAALNLIIAPFNIYETMNNPGESPVWVIASFAAMASMMWALGVMVRNRFAKAPAVALQGLVPTP
jgi:TRAP-type mannitol/chloroaromatic compound transport system permease small subunit